MQICIVAKGFTFFLDGLKKFLADEGLRRVLGGPKEFPGARVAVGVRYLMQTFCGSVVGPSTVRTPLRLMFSLSIRTTRSAGLSLMRPW